MAVIAEGYMDIDDVKIKNLRYENKDNAEAFNMDVIKYWRNKNPHNQVQKLAQILFEAAEDCGYVDPKKVEQILKTSQEDASLPKLPKVTYSNFIHLAEDLRPHMTRTMKMEPAPWIRDYVVDMEEIYTELSLEKIINRLFREERKKLENYKVLFEPGMFEYMYIRYYIPENIRHNIPSLRPKKILLKGNPGMGKTSLVKKITYDWAKGEFDEISMVFFVFLKLVKPGDFIENVIMLQNPMSEGLHVTAAKLANILDRFGPECLLILDGLDECALGQNNDVLKVIRGSKLKNSNVILTSRPHSTREFESCFDTIVSVEGFTRSEARKFARRIVDDEGKVEQILNFNPAGERSDVSFQDRHEVPETGPHSVHNVPILLSFLCLLVREDNIDLSDKLSTLAKFTFEWYDVCTKSLQFERE